LKHRNRKRLEYSIGSPTFFEWKMRRPSKRCQHFQCPCISPGLGFYGKVSVSSRDLSQVSISEVTVLTTSPNLRSPNYGPRTQSVPQSHFVN